MLVNCLLNVFAICVGEVTVLSVKVICIVVMKCVATLVGVSVLLIISEINWPL